MCEGEAFACVFVRVFFTSTKGLLSRSGGFDAFFRRRSEFVGPFHIIFLGEHLLPSYPREVSLNARFYPQCHMDPPPDPPPPSSVVLIVSSFVRKLI